MTTPAIESDDGDEDDPRALVDDAGADDTVVQDQYQIASYGADYDVEGLVRRIQRGDIFVPSFQRQFMWNQQEASRFIESLLLGLPVPGIFLAADPTTGKLLVIDGQQRLKTLQFFYEGAFDPKVGAKEKRVFSLTKVQEPFEGKSYAELHERDRLRLDNAIIHATVVKQEAPKDGDTSIYHIFERLNNGGRRLTGQEIRSALYSGALIKLLDDEADNATWRRLFGAKSKRLKDQELLLRFIGLYFESEKYEKPMKEFLNRFAGRFRNPPTETITAWRALIETTLACIDRVWGPSAFRLGAPLNAALCDAVMVGVATRLAEKSPPDDAKLKVAYTSLIANDDFLQAITRATSDDGSVKTRLSMAKAAFRTS